MKKAGKRVLGWWIRVLIDVVNIFIKISGFGEDLTNM